MSVTAVPMSGFRRSILVVEDHADTADVMRRMLSMHGHEVTIVPSVAKAAELGDRLFDLIIADVGLPDGSGRTVLKHFPQSQVRAIAVSGYASAEDKEMSLAAGFQEHLGKPIRLDELIKTIERVCQNPA